MSYIGIAPHKDDEIVGFGTMLARGGVEHIFFVTEANDGRRDMAIRVCEHFGISYTMLDYPQMELINLVEEDRRKLIRTIQDEIYRLGLVFSPWLIPSCIDRNHDHTVLGAWLPRYSPKGSLFYSYTDTLPGGVCKRFKEPMPEKAELMKKFYPTEYEILESKGIIYPECYYATIKCNHML